METRMKSRSRNVDIARGIAMICIVLGHLEGWDNWALKRAVFPFHVPVFFLITGWFFRPEKNWKTFLARKAKGLLLPYVTIGIGMAVFSMLLHIFVYHGTEPLRFLRDGIFAMLYGAGDDAARLLNVPQIGAVWFLLASFWGCVLLRLVLGMKPWIRPFAVLALVLAGTMTRSVILPLGIQPAGPAVMYMYIGWLARSWNGKRQERGISFTPEIRAAAALTACAGWYSMWSHFSTFWLVHADIGRGTLDIFGSLCACGAVLMLSGLIDRRVNFLARPLSVLGKYSIVMLCAHIVELNWMPWWKILEKLQALGMSEALRIPVLAVMKFVWIFLFMAIAVKIPLFRFLFGIQRETRPWHRAAVIGILALLAGMVVLACFI